MSRYQDVEDPRIKDFLQYLENKTPTNDFTRRLDQMVEELKAIEMGFSDYIAARQKEFDWLRQGKEQGFEEGREVGLQQGLERGAYETKLETARNLTQFQFAEKADISEETVKNIELYRCWTSDKNLAKITEALEVDIYQLFLPVSTSLGKDSENLIRMKKSIADNLRNYIETKLNEIIK